ncbi:hypothetical protein Mame01_28550 [Microbispora amethystogenes]|nr:hypothetical protein Mame01_28550 [Microbispora amethystogenes]
MPIRLQPGFRTGEAASLGWMTKRNGWAITEAGVRALQDFPGTEFYRELARQYRARRLPPQSRVYRDPRWNVVLEALKRLEPGAWTTYGDLPAVELFEKVHHHDEPLGEMFRAHLERHFAFMTFQNPEKIKEGFAHVSPVNLWVRVAEVLTDQDSRNPITADEAEATIEWLETMAIAIQLALGDPLPEASPNTGEIRATPSTAAAGQADGPRRKRIWDEPSFLQAVEHYCPADVRATLLAVYRHAESHPSFHEYYFGEGEYPSVTAWFNLGSDKASVWSVYTGPAKSVLAVNFGSLRHHGASRERMARLAERLGILPGSARLRDQLESADYEKYPSLQPVALAHPEAREIIIAALNEFLAGGILL